MVVLQVEWGVTQVVAPTMNSSRPARLVRPPCSPVVPKVKCKQTAAASQKIVVNFRGQPVIWVIYQHTLRLQPCSTATGWITYRHIETIILRDQSSKPYVATHVPPSRAGNLEHNDWVLSRRCLAMPMPATSHCPVVKTLTVSQITVLPSPYLCGTNEGVEINLGEKSQWSQKQLGKPNLQNCYWVLPEILRETEIRLQVSAIPQVSRIPLSILLCGSVPRVWMSNVVHHQAASGGVSLNRRGPASGFASSSLLVPGERWKIATHGTLTAHINHGSIWLHPWYASSDIICICVQPNPCRTKPCLNHRRIGYQ